MSKPTMAETIARVLFAKDENRFHGADMRDCEEDALAITDAIEAHIREREAAAVRGFLEALAQDAEDQMFEEIDTGKDVAAWIRAKATGEGE